ncbi:unnamed protein product, partial [Discosporangium mesarthrocarpum]
SPGGVPVTILTGFLGSGKTTLLNYILTQDHGRRIAVIENEIGDSIEIEKLIARDGVDGSLLADNLFELNNGCICCTVKDDLVTTLENLLKRRSKFDYIIIETTGLANPGPVASVFWLDEALESALRLDCIVTLVDAKNIGRHLQPLAESKLDPSSRCKAEEHEGGGVGAGVWEDGGGGGEMHPTEASMQIAFADRIIVNKIDLVSPGELDELIVDVRTINAVADMRVTQKSVVDIDWILDVRCFNPEFVLAINPALGGPASFMEGAGECGRGCGKDSIEAGVCASDCGSGHERGQSNVCGGSDSNGGAAAQAQVTHRSGCSENGDGRRPRRKHHREVTTHAVERVGDANIARLNRWIGDLLWEGGGEGGTEVCRIKGLVSVEGRVEKFVVQGVYDLFDVTPATSAVWAEGEERRCKLVFIGKHLRLEDLEEGLGSCMV